jgi:hypothetical protein
VDLLATAAEGHGVRWKEARGNENRLPFRDLKSSHESRVSVPNFKNKSSVVVKRIKVMPEKESCHSPIAAHVPPRLARDLRPRVKRKVQDAHAQENENNKNGAKGVKTIHDNLLFLLPERGERICMYIIHTQLETRLHMQTRMPSLSHFHALTRAHVSGHVDAALQTGAHVLVETQWKLTRLLFTFQGHFGGGESGSVCCLPTQDTASLGGNTPILVPALGLAHVACGTKTCSTIAKTPAEVEKFATSYVLDSLASPQVPPPLQYGGTPPVKTARHGASPAQNLVT